MVTVIRGSSSLLILILDTGFTPRSFTPGHPYNRLGGPWGSSRSSGVERNFSHLPGTEPMIIQLIVYSVTKELAVFVSQQYPLK
jgi:hypothetical protein